MSFSDIANFAPQGGNTLQPLVCVMHTPEVAKRVPQGYRMARIQWRNTEKKKEAGEVERSTMGVPVPLLPISVHPSCIAAHMQKAFEGLQDGVIRKYVGEEMEANPGINVQRITIPIALTTYEGVAAALSEEASNTRLSKDMLERWFQAFLLEPFAEKLRTVPGMSDAFMEKSLQDHERAVSKLAGVKTVYAPREALQLQKLIALAPASDPVRAHLWDKLERWINPPTEASSFAILDTLL